jgi:hypothetical protein
MRGLLAFVLAAGMVVFAAGAVPHPVGQNRMPNRAPPL